MEFNYVFMDRRIGLTVLLLLTGFISNARLHNNTHRLQTSKSIITVTRAITLDSSHSTVLGNTSKSSFTITLPSPIGIAGRTYTIKKTGTGGIDNALIIAPRDGTIDGEPKYIIYNDYSFVTLQANGTSWNIIRN